MNFLGTLCLILVATTIAGHLSTKLNFPVVIGQLLVGVIIGPTFLNLIQANDFIKLFSEIGVVILMFMAGLESDLHLLLRFIKPSILVASTGMLLPLVSFYFIGLLFNLDNKESIFFRSNLRSHVGFHYSRSFKRNESADQSRRYYDTWCSRC